MTKVLYTGHFLEQSAWATVSQNNILAMDSVGIDVVPRAIRLGLPAQYVPERILELEQKSSKGCDVCIQHLLPHHMSYDSRMKCIGIYELEHHGIENTRWSNHLNLMDELWVPCREMIKYADEDGIKDDMDMRYIPHTFDFSKYNNTNVLDIPQIKGDFTFYFIGELHRRKHLASLLRAFHTEFSPYENVSLVLKVNKHGLTDEQTQQELEHVCDVVKSGLRLHKDNRIYKKEVIISHRLSEEELMGLHNACDCYVNPSFGEAWSITLMEALALGNLGISTNCGGPKDYLHPGLLVKCEKEPIIGLTDSEMFSGMGTGKEWWWNINTSELQRKMRYVYKMQQFEKDEYRDYHKEKLKSFTFENVGNKIREALNE